MAADLDRALLLLNQSRFDLAEKELRGSLASRPDDPLAHAFLALCLVHRQLNAEADREVGEAIRLAPYSPFVHYVRAKVLFHQDRLDEAEAALGEAIRLDPGNAAFFALLAAIHFERRRWADALRAAEQGLQHDAEHVDCANLRAMALVKLGRKREAEAAIDGALAKDPENALSHANQGWTSLDRGDHRKALEHFREALRIDPELDWARAGIVEALKARHLIYRVMLRYFLWMAKLSGKAQWAVILGLVFGREAAIEAVRANPGFGLVLWPFLIVSLIFILLSWIASPLFDLLLRLNRFGRHALTRDEVVASNWVGACLLGAVGSYLALLATDHRHPLLSFIVFIALILPVAATYHCPAGWRRRLMGGYTILLAGFGFYVVISPFLVPDNVSTFVLGVVGSSWLGLVLSRPH